MLTQKQVDARFLEIAFNYYSELIDTFTHASMHEIERMQVRFFPDEVDSDEPVLRSDEELQTLRDSLLADRDEDVSDG